MQRKEMVPQKFRNCRNEHGTYQRSPNRTCTTTNHGHDDEHDGKVSVKGTDWLNKGKPIAVGSTDNGCQKATDGKADYLEHRLLIPSTFAASSSSLIAIRAYLKLDLARMEHKTVIPIRIASILQ